MSKRRKKRRKRNSHARLRVNRHHLLFQRSHWSSSSSGLKLRELFVYEMSVYKHDKLHAQLHDIPMPSEDELNDILDIVLHDIDLVKTFNEVEACEYLASIANFEPFKAVMRYQADILRH